MILFPVGWSPKTCEHMLARYPEQCIHTPESSLCDVLYHAIAGRPVFASEFEPYTPDNRSPIERVFEHIHTLLYPEGSVVGSFSSNSTLALPDTMSDCVHVDENLREVTPEMIPIEYRFDGIGGSKYQFYWTRIYTCTYHYDRYRLWQRYYRDVNGWGLLDLIDSLERDDFLAFIQDSSNPHHAAWAEMSQQEDELIENVQNQWVDDPLVEFEERAVYYVMTNRQYAVPDSEQVVSFAPANELAQNLFERGLGPLTADMVWQQTVRSDRHR